MSENADIIYDLKSLLYDVMSGKDAINNSEQALLEKRHVLRRAIAEIELLRKQLDVKLVNADEVS